MKLCICHIVSGDLWAGAEAMAFQLIVALQAKPDTDVIVIALNDGELAARLRAAGVEVFVIDERKHAFPSIFFIAAEALRARRIDILHGHRYKENLLAFLLSRLCKRKARLISTQHGMPELHGKLPGFLQRLKLRTNQYLLSKKFAGVVAVSADIGKAMAGQGFEGCQVTVIRNGIQVPLITFDRQRSSHCVFGSAGRFFPVKDFPLMVDIAAQVAMKNCDVSFRLAGEGPAEADIRSSMRRHNLDRTFVLGGFVADVGSFYSALDVYINTSHHEGIPMSVLEAMAYELPVVAPSVGGPCEIITHGVDGFLVEGRDAAEFAEKCLMLSRDSELRESMGKAARNKVTAIFSVDRMVTEYLTLYRRVARPG